MSNTSSAFGGLRKRVWLYKDLSIKTKYALYHTIVLSTLLYGAETGMVYKADAQRHHIDMMCHLHEILNVKWWQYIPNKFILEKSKLSGMYDILAQCNLRWACHLNRLEDRILPKQILYSQLREGSHKTGKPKLGYKDIIKRNPGVMSIPLDNWQYLSKNKKMEEKNWQNVIIKYTGQLIVVVLSFILFFQLCTCNLH